MSEQMAKGNLAVFIQVFIQVDDVHAVFEIMRRDDGVEVLPEPTDQPYGIRDCRVRNPAALMCGSANHWPGTSEIDRE